jgi:hypothetical protein
MQPYFKGVNVMSLLVTPPAFTVWTPLGDAPALAAMLKVAVIVESFTTWRLLTVTPEPDTTREVVPVRWLPVRVTLKLGLPRSCELGLIAASTAAVTVNVVVGLPPGVCTVTVLAP